MTLTLTNGDESKSISLSLWKSIISIAAGLIVIASTSAGAASWFATRAAHEWYDTSGAAIVEQMVDQKIQSHETEAELRTERMFNKLLVEIEKLKVLVSENI